MDVHKTRGFTVVELLIVVAIIGIIGVIAVPGLLRARLTGNEASAIGALRAIHSAESAFSSSCGAGGYAQSLEDLAKPPTGSSQGFISSDLDTTGIIKSGYYVSVARDAAATVVATASKTCNASTSPAVSSYFAEAHPVAVGSTGQRSFGASNQGTIYFKTSGAPVAPDFSDASVLE